MPVKNELSIAKKKFKKCRDINGLLNWLSECAADFSQALDNHQQVRLLLDYNVYSFKENEFNSIAYQLDEIERDIKILYRKVKVIERNIGDMPSNMSSIPWMEKSNDVIVTYNNYSYKWKKVFDKLQCKLNSIFTYVLK